MGVKHRSCSSRSPPQDRRSTGLRVRRRSPGARPRPGSPLWFAAPSPPLGRPRFHALENKGTIVLFSINSTIVLSTEGGRHAIHRRQGDGRRCAPHSHDSIVSVRQAPLRRLYADHPREALTSKKARTSAARVPASDPFHGEVEIGEGHGTSLRFGLDRHVGGLHDAPNPGDLLCAALAACADGAIRMVADLLAVRLTALEVEVCGELDVRGCLGAGRDVRRRLRKALVHCAFGGGRGNRSQAARCIGCLCRARLRQPRHTARRDRGGNSCGDRRRQRPSGAGRAAVRLPW